jgi:hypothetical protein
MFKRFGMSCLLLLLSVGATFAQKDPVLEVRVKSVEGLLAYAEYLGDLANQGEVARQLAEFVKTAAEGKTGLEGVDIKRPVGVYSFMTADVVDSPIVVMVPIANREAMLDLLQGKLNLDPRKIKDDEYSVDVPNVPEPVSIYFKNGYAYLVGSYAKRGNAVTLIEPKTFFVKSTSDAAIDAKLHVERIPESVRKAIIANAELKFADAKERTEPGETPAMKQLRSWALGEGFTIAHQILTEAKVLQLQLAIQPKSDNITINVELVSQAGSKLQKQFEALGSRPGLAGTWLQSKEKAVSLTAVNVGLGAEQKKSLAPVIEAVFKELLDRANGPEQKAARLVVEAIKPTLLAAEFDFLSAVPAEGKRGQLPVLIGLKVVGGRKIEETIKKLELLIPETAAKLTFDVKKQGDFTLHKVELQNVDQVKEVLGTNVLWLAVSDTVLLASLEAEPKLMLQAIEAVQAGRKPTPLLLQTGSITSIMRIVEDQLNPEKFETLVKDVFETSPKGKDQAALQLLGGESLKLSFTLNGKVLKFLVSLDQEKKK